MGILAFGVFLFVQAAASFSVNPQPYPAVRMPRFGQAPNAAGLFASTRLDVTIHFADGEEQQVVPADLAGDVRYSEVQAMLARGFRGKQGADLDPDLRLWLANRVSALDSRRATRVTFCWRSVAIDVAKARAAHTSPCDLTKVRLVP